MCPVLWPVMKKMYDIFVVSLTSFLQTSALALLASKNANIKPRERETWYFKAYAYNPYDHMLLKFL